MTATLEYRELLAREAPAAITSARAYKSTLMSADALMAKRRLSSAESKLFDLLVIVIETYEYETDPIEPAEPHVVLRELMNARHMKQVDLAKVLGSNGLVSDILHGKRSLSKAHIAKLAALFRVSPAVFLSEAS